MAIRILFYVLITGFLFSCSSNNKEEQYKALVDTSLTPNITITKNKHNSLNPTFIGDTLLHGYSKQMQYYLNKYLIDSCVVQKYSDSTLIKEFEGVNQLGDLNNDNLSESVFVLPALNFCEEGESYYFSDINLPRLLTDSYCCHPNNIFSVGDIDEDGISEIGQFYSSCASRFKSINIFTLKNHNWTKIGSCVFDLGYSKPEEKFSNFVRKISKGKFEMLEITDLTEDKTKVGKKNWLKFTM